MLNAALQAVGSIESVSAGSSDSDLLGRVLGAAASAQGRRVAGQKQTSSRTEQASPAELFDTEPFVQAAKRYSSIQLQST